MNEPNNHRLSERRSEMKPGFEERAMAFTIPKEFLKQFDEARILFPPYPGLLIIDARMLGKVQELMRNPAMAEQFEVMLVPKVMG
jgi:hypothetical protein